MTERVLDVKDLSVSFVSFGEETKIVRNVDFHIDKGEIIGIVGESGCGKSMTAMAIMQLINRPPGVISGEILLDENDLLEKTENQMLSVRGNDISMIFQEPMTSLNPVLTVGYQMMEVFRVHQGMSKKEAWAASVEALRKVRIALPEERMKCYPHELSGGMRQRVMIAMALACRPRLLIADEPTTALDVTIQAQILRLMKELSNDIGSSVMLITHDLGVVSETCSRAVIFYCGQIVEEGQVQDLFRRPLHPYTEGLLKSLPKRGSTERLHVIPGSVPSLKTLPEGCVFPPRCEYACDRCQKQAPQLKEIENGHCVRCWRYEGEEVRE